MTAEELRKEISKDYDRDLDMDDLFFIVKKYAIKFQSEAITKTVKMAVEIVNSYSSSSEYHCDCCEGTAGAILSEIECLTPERVMGEK